MNERIRLLAEQADKWSAEEYHQLFLANESPDRQKLFNEKFAELIVKECISVMDTTAKEARENFTYMDNDVPTTAHQFEIRKHFGVEK